MKNQFFIQCEHLSCLKWINDTIYFVVCEFNAKDDKKRINVRSHVDDFFFVYLKYQIMIFCNKFRSFCICRKMFIGGLSWQTSPGMY
jgi:hypothetical protein